MAKNSLIKTHGALKICAKTPGEIVELQEKYERLIADVYHGDNYRIYSNEWKNTRAHALRAECRSKVKKMTDSLQKSCEFLLENDELASQRLDLNSDKMKNAIAIISMLGHDLGGEEQLNILDEFRGDLPALKFLAQVYKKNGLFFADRAEELSQPVSQKAIEDLLERNAYFDYDENAVWEPGQSKFSLGEFKNAAERFGIDLEKNPSYVTAMSDIRITNFDRERLKLLRDAKETVKNVKGESTADTIDTMQGIYNAAVKLQSEE